MNQANERWGKSVRLFGFPNGCEEGHEPHMQRLLRRRPRLGHLHQPHIQAEVGRGPGVAATPSPPLGGKELGGSQADGPGSQRVPWWLFGKAREEPLAKRVSPLGR